MVGYSAQKGAVPVCCAALTRAQYTLTADKVDKHHGQRFNNGPHRSTIAAPAVSSPITTAVANLEPNKRLAKLDR